MLPPKVQRQTMLFSATYPTDIQQLCKTALRPEHQLVDTVGETEVQTAEKVRHASQLAAPLLWLLWALHLHLTHTPTADQAVGCGLHHGVPDCTPDAHVEEAPGRGPKLQGMLMPPPSRCMLQSNPAMTYMTTFLVPAGHGLLHHSPSDRAVCRDVQPPRDACSRATLQEESGSQAGRCICESVPFSTTLLTAPQNRGESSSPP